ncbi:acyltransferase family protein [Methylobacterium tarhaniae]|uniref:acyltransferase family protein n=1 Tax=Methylobacterium tarhaniae TaxID=1187852 RepID=UPI001FD939EE|nr:acyltransferase [Methylobacterium tarhaniae]
MSIGLNRDLPGLVTGSSHPAPVRSAPAAEGLARAGRDLANLQLLRALAASLVLVHHVAVYAQTLRGAGRPWAVLDELMGVWGVAIFFALSGFLMARLITRDPPLVFLAHRVGRIVPTYFAVVALFAGLFAALGLELGGVSVLALSLAPAGQRSSPLNVEWTLVLELTFYLGLFLLAAAGQARRLVPVAAAWLALLAVAFPLLPPDSRNMMPPPLYLVPVTAACAPFAGGLLLPRLIASGWIRPATALLALPFAAACFVVDTAAARWLGGIAAVLIVGAAVTAPPVRRQGPAARGLIALGDWSYVLYLTHPPVLMLANWACPPHWPGPAYAAVCLAGALAVTALLGPVDLAFYHRLRRRIDTLRPATLKRALAAFILVFTGCALWGSIETARNDWAESRARHAIALAGGSWGSVAAAEAAIAERGLALPALRASVESMERISAKESLVTAHAFDPAAPDRGLHLALFCGGRLVALERPRRMRRDLAGRPGYEAMGQQRVGYRVRLPAAACSLEDTLALVVDGAGLMAVLPIPPMARHR